MSTPPPATLDPGPELPPTGAGQDHGEPPWSRLQQFIMLAALAVMALVDAYGFWNTLTLVIHNATDMVLAFVIGLSLAAVFVAHEIGRIARSRREASGGGVAWILALSACWLGLGLVMAWIRLQQPLSAGASLTGTLASPAVATVDVAALQIAALLLVFYLLTGGIAMTNAYRYSDPRTLERRAALRRRERLLRQVTEEFQQLRLTEQLMRERRNQLERDDEAHERRGEEVEAVGALLREDARLDQMRHHGDPGTTDGLRNQPQP